MYTPTKKRRLPAWATSGNSPGSHQETKSATNGVVKAKVAKASCASDGPRTQKTGARPSVKEETKAAGGASSSKAKEQKVSSDLDGYVDKDVKTRPGIKKELDAVTDTTASERICFALSTTGVMEEELKIPIGISERRSNREVRAKVKQEPEEMVEGVPLMTDKLDRRNLSTNNEELNDMKERRRQLLRESSRKKSHDALQRQKKAGESWDDDEGNYTSATHRVTTDESGCQQYGNRKVQQMCQNELQSDNSNDVEEKDTSVSLAPQKAESGNCKSLVRQFSKLLEGVVFTISGLVNPERAEIRKMALDMGAEYRPSWSSDSTLLIAALADTPSFNQVKVVGGTIVHKDWLVECYKRKELIPIEKYMMHVGNPWRAGQDVDEPFFIGVENESPSQTEQVKSHKTETASDDQKKLQSTSAVDHGTKINKVPGMVENKAPRAEIQRWFVEDLENLRSWLEAQSEKVKCLLLGEELLSANMYVRILEFVERLILSSCLCLHRDGSVAIVCFQPEKDMLDYTAALGLVACLDDAIRSLEEHEGLKLVLGAWAFIPRAIKELEKELSQVSRTERLVREAERIKSIYTSQIQKMNLGDPPMDAQTDDDATEIISDTDTPDSADYSSDDTEDLGEDEITQCQIQIMRRFALD